MWFRGVAASVGLCFDFGAVLEGHPDVLLSVNGDVVHHRQPVCFPELRQRLPASQLIQLGFDLMFAGFPLGNQIGDFGLSALGLVEPGDQRIVAFLVFRLVEGDMCVFIDAVFDELGSDVDFRFQLGFRASLHTSQFFMISLRSVTSRPFLLISRKSSYPRQRL